MLPPHLVTTLRVMTAEVNDSEPLLTPAEVAAMFRVDPKTVTRWAKSDEGKRRIAEGEAERQREREAETAARRATAAEARKRVQEIALKAVEMLEKALDDEDVHARLRAAREVLDRAGVPRTSKVEVTSSVLDLSKLSDEEIATLDTLTTKASV